ncbi:MAG: type II toxin-antitoxin system HicB family antitoxin [Acidimicrobiaceae bacterium]|nr:type II toxin-antitoxin system HicB family antitoxin [Acidimicrobiaceae bacterium]
MIIEKTANGCSAYLPDLLGCVAAADTREETEALIQQVVVGHLDMLRANGKPVSEPYRDQLPGGEGVNNSGSADIDTLESDELAC